MCDSGCDEVPRFRFSVKKERETYREVTFILSDIFLQFYGWQPKASEKEINLSQVGIRLM